MLAALLITAGCTADLPGIIVHPFDPDNPGEPNCLIAENEIFLAASGRDAIPALSDMDIVLPTNSAAQYIEPDDRIIGIRIGADVVAIPVKILWYHEILNVDLAGRPFAVTHCPLTGSSLAFDRGPAGGVEFGVSGLLYRNNLMMYDRNDVNSLWPQLSMGARCGPRKGTDLAPYPVMEMTYSSWLEMHPTTWVLSGNTGHDNRYNVDPYGDYASNDEVLFPVELDFRRPLKERVLGVRDGAGGVAYPFGDLASLGELAVVEHIGADIGDGSTFVFWDSEAQTAAAYSNVVDGSELTFEVVGDQIVDQETGSVWQVNGVAVSGTHAGVRLQQVSESYIAFWFAWAAFEENATLWEAA
jgi:hypothetical protein